MIELRCGDCLELMKALPNGSVDAGVTSPQYNLGGDFHSSSVSDSIRRTYGGYDGDDDNLPEPEYQRLQVVLLNELHRVIKPGGWLFYVHKNRIKNGRIISPLTWIQNSPWIVYQDVIIDMNGSTNVDKRRFFPSHEIVFVLSSKEGMKLHNDGCYPSVWRFPQINRKDSKHPAAFHVELAKRCIFSSTNEGETVIDSNMGVGTTGLACVKSGRHFIGYEINPDYFAIAEKRIADAQLQMTMDLQ